MDLRRVEDDGAGPGVSRLARAGAVLLALAVASLAGCSTLRINVTVEPVDVPAPLARRIPARLGLHFPPAFRDARPEVHYFVGGDHYIWRYALGASAQATFRRALAGMFDEVVVLDAWPAPANETAALDAVMILQPPEIRGTMDVEGVVEKGRDWLSVPIELRSPADALLARWTIEGTAASHVLFMRERMVATGALRSASAALVASLQRPPASEALPAPRASEIAALPAESAAPGVVPVRIDAGLAHGDGFERRIATCLADVLPEAPGLPATTAAGTLRDALFPWLDPGVIDPSSPGVQALLASAPVQARLRALGVGKLVLFSVTDAGRDKDESMGCFGGFGAGACLGLYETSTRYGVDVVIWDVAERRPLRADRAEVLRAIGAVGLVIPIPYFRSTEAEACGKLRQFVTSVVGAKP